MAYLQDLVARERDGGGEAEPTCFLCEAANAEADSELARQHHVLINDDRGVLMLNLYPYTTGHLLVVPPDHVGRLNDLSPEARAGLMALAAEAEALLERTFHPQGHNIGMNLGRAAGAGVPGHLHLHVVPRWHGDTNFMSVAGDIRVVPESIEATWQRLREAL